MLYPIKLSPQRLTKIWGEELWTFSSYPGNESTVLNGKFAGMKLSELGNFPLLIKFIHCQEDLSIQVHPNDYYAKKLDGEVNGKNECWYVLEASPGAKLVLGHKLETPETFQNALETGQLEKYLNYVKVKPGDFFYVPAGTLHSLGKGISLVEVQQSSDLTYRVYDWNRCDEKGKKRPLHIEKALQVLNYKKSPAFFIGGETRGKRPPYTTPFFSIEWLEIHDYQEFMVDSCFCALTILAGEGTISGNGMQVDCSKGETILIPEKLSSYCIFGKEVKILKSFVPQPK